MSSQKLLAAHIIKRSAASTFDQARLEWRLDYIIIGDTNCPCSQAIKEVCFIINPVTKHTTYVGNVCINKFFGIDTGNMFASLAKLTKDYHHNPNRDLINHAFLKWYITEQEREFLLDTEHQRNFSIKQFAWKERIGYRITHRKRIAEYQNRTQENQP